MRHSRLALVLLLLSGCGRCGQTVVSTRDAPHAEAPPGDPDLPGVARVDPDLEARLRAALADMPESYAPRTHHLRPNGSPKYVNRLILESSPYLLQHAHNPVNWFPWGEEAFRRARALGRPILLSVGYSTCHWCHVMERESFEDEEIAAYINRHFVPIKVDRESRPDVDEVYMTAVRLLTGGGGWPMTVILTPDGTPFFGGTYFPPRARGGRPGLLDVLRRTAEAYARDPEGVAAKARALTQAIERAAAPAPGGDLPGTEALHQAAARLAASYDPVFGGFGRAPKFPRPASLDFLLRYHHHTGDPAALRMVVETLEHLSAGGIHDHVGGGFHRYSVTRDWSLPHFEKMLYDNAQLASLYLAAYQVTGREDFADLAREILTYLVREMRDPAGGFYSATDADSPGPDGHPEEGRFFTWTPEEVRAVLGEEAEIVIEHYGIRSRGPVDGRSVLAEVESVEETATRHGIGAAALRRRLATALARLREARARRPPPHRDEKVLAAWNGLVLSALARAGLVLGEERWTLHARALAAFLDREMTDTSGRMIRSWHAGKTSGPGYLADQAFVVQGLLDLFEATGDPAVLERARRLQAAQDRAFLDSERGGYFLTPTDGESLLARPKPAHDGALPAGNSVSAMNLLRLSAFTLDPVYRDRAERTLAAFARQIGTGMPAMLSALAFYRAVPKEVALVGEEEAVAPLRAVVGTTYLPERALVLARPQKLPRLTRLIPWLEEKTAGPSGATAYVCERQRCDLPTRDPQVLRRQLEKQPPLFASPPPQLVLGAAP